MGSGRTASSAALLDDSDPLAHCRSRFIIPPGLIYLDGNSLGALPVAVPERVGRTLVDEWGSALISGWEECGWMEAPERLGDRIAPLIGAESGEVLVADTTSVALAKLIGAALTARPERHIVLTTSDNFPSDLYAAAGAAEAFGGTLRVVERDEVLTALGGDVAVCCLTHVDFRTGEMYDLPAITRRTHEVGALSLWDLCHSAGALEIGLEEHGVDLAVGCTYKYLNGGPGSPGFLYVRRELQDKLENPIRGWLGHAEPFSFETVWESAPGVRRFLTSTPPVVALAALEAALSCFDGVAMAHVREKSVSLTELFIDALAEMAPPSLTLVSPPDPSRRGSQVSIRHPRARDVVAAAAAKGVVGDHRSPDICRFGFAPLYLTHEEVVRAAETVSDVARLLA